MLDHSATLWMKWLAVAGLLLAVPLYQVSFQYLVQAALHSALARRKSAAGEAVAAKGKADGAYSVWKKMPTPMKFQSMVAWYNLLARIDKKNELLFINHGYAPEPGAEKALAIPADLERFRYPIELYDLIARQVDWQGKDALEVSSGLGGGSLWIKRAYSPRSLTGLDIAAQAVRKCNERYGALGIQFKAGDAQAMPFGDRSFDIVINVESSLNYPDMAAFLGEVHRVLRPGGYFLFADYRSRSKMIRLREMLDAMPLEVEMLTDITPGILRGLEREEARKIELIERRAPRLLKSTILRFAGVSEGETSERHQFASGKRAYIAAVLRKMPDARGGDGLAAPIAPARS